VSEDEEQDRCTNEKVEVEWSFRETVDTSDSGLYYKVACHKLYLACISTTTRSIFTN